VTVRPALLQLLDEGPRHGYQLKVDFETRTGGIWPLNVGQVYTTLDRLARDGCVEEIEAATAPASAGPPGPQRTYRITEDGRGELKAWLGASPTDSGPPRDELITKVLLAIGRNAEHALDVIDDQRGALLLALQLGRREQRTRQDPAERLAHDAVLARTEADLTWLDRCEAEVLAGRDRENGDRTNGGRTTAGRPTKSARRAR
jgi:DNA-binding PadR family transcriptional regulator